MGTRNGASGLVAAIAVAQMLAGCASTGTMKMPSLSSVPGMSDLTAPSTWVPTVDPVKLNKTRYDKDYAECKAFAEADPTTNASAAVKKKAMKWGLGGVAIVGAASLATGGAATIPMMLGNAALTGGAAAATGGYSAKNEAEIRYRSIITSCLTGRGYSVLN